jgi:hypothetical protein
MSSPSKPQVPMEIEISYHCTHLSCRNPKCYKGALQLSKQAYQLLFDSETEANIMRSPTGFCKLGSPQRFEIIAVSIGEKIARTPKDQMFELVKQREVKQQELNQIRATYEKQQEILRSEIARIESQLATVKALLKQSNTSE